MGLKVNQCCCGCSLHTGTKVIGWLCLVFEIVNLVMNVFTIGYVGASSMTTFSENGNLDKYLISEIVGIVISAVAIAVTVPLLIAAYKNSRPMLLLPWLIFDIINTIATIGIWVYKLNVEETFGAEKIVFISSTFLGYALTIYFWLVVYSYYQQLKEI